MPGTCGTRRSGRSRGRPRTCGRTGSGSPGTSAELDRLDRALDDAIVASEEFAEWIEAELPELERIASSEEYDRRLEESVARYMAFR
ncbi:MAG: hypothetical protein ACN0LA_08785 [Candidatus Longimicrobiales bacterium M2_2A_002]